MPLLTQMCACCKHLQAAWALHSRIPRLFNAEQPACRELSAISTVTQALVAETELEAMIQLIGSQTRETFQADIAYVALLDPQMRRDPVPISIWQIIHHPQTG